jgi:hypothetical protein
MGNMKNRGDKPFLVYMAFTSFVQPILINWMVLFFWKAVWSHRKLYGS